MNMYKTVKKKAINFLFIKKKEKESTIGNKPKKTSRGR